MVTSATKQTLFLEKPELKAAMMLTVLGPPKISESKLLFCINHTGSGMSDCSISFKYENPLTNEIRYIFSKAFNIVEKLKWVEEARKVLYAKPKKERQSRNAPLADDSSSI